MLQFWLPLNLSVFLLTILVSTPLYLCNTRSVRWQLFLGASVLSFPAFVVDTVILAYAQKLTPYCYDQHVYCFDRLFGSPEFAIGRLYASVPILQKFAELAYTMLPALLTILMMAYFLLLPVRESVRYVWTSILILAPAPLLYVAFPACGPRFAFPGFPWVLPMFVEPHAMHLLATPNAIPSIHFSCSLMVWYFARRWRVGAVLSGLYTALIIWYVLGTGEHYLFDLVAAIPYAALMIYLGWDGWPVSQEFEPTTSVTCTSGTGSLYASDAD